MKKIPIWKNIVLLVSALMVVVIATFAWFYTFPTSNINELGLNVIRASYIQISGDGGNSWSEELGVEIGINKKFKEISGNGAEFFAPVYDIAENPSGGYSMQIVSFDKVADSEYYYEQTLYFRADLSRDLYLSPESYVVSVDEQGNSYIDGAIRAAFFEVDENGNDVLSYIWAPNSTVEYSADTNSFNREGSVEPYYYYQISKNIVNPADLEEPTTDVVVVPTEGIDVDGCGYNETYRFMWSNGQNLPDNAPPVLTLDTLGGDNLVYKTLKVKVWLEGYDRECVSLLSGQKFTMKLQFVAQEGE